MTLKLEKIDLKRKADEVQEKVSQIQELMKKKDEEHTQEIKEIREKLHSDQTKLVEEKVEKFRILAEQLQRKQEGMLQEIKSKNEIVVEKQEEINNLKQQVSQYKEIVSDSQNNGDLEEELENTRYELTEQIKQDQLRHNQEILDLTDLMDKKVKNLEDKLTSERTAFNDQLVLLQQSAADSSELSTIESKLADSEKALKLEKSK